MTMADINSNTYVIAIDNTSRTVQLTAAGDGNMPAIELYNDSTLPVFVYTSVAPATIVFPTVGNMPQPGKVIAAKGTLSWSQNIVKGYVNAIQLASGGVGNLYISPIAGDN